MGFGVRQSDVEPCGLNFLIFERRIFVVKIKLAVIRSPVLVRNPFHDFVVKLNDFVNKIRKTK
jgi:hypothetical protein